MGRTFFRWMCLALVPAAFACTRTDDPLKIVRAYNDAVILAHRTGDTSRLADVAGEREARLVSVLIATKRGAGLVLEATLENLAVDRVQKPSVASMLIETSERWRYFDRPLKLGGNPGQPILAAMKVRYECEQSGGAWKVMKMIVLEHVILNGKEAGKQG
jgi:hypothetical protein